MSRIFLILAAFVLGAVTVLGVLYLLRNGTESTTKLYGDWKLSCPPPSSTTSACALTQDIIQNGTGVTLVHLQATRVDAAKRLVIVLPYGVLLEPGLGVSIGGASPRLLQYQTCDTVGCRAVLPLDQATIETLKGAEFGRIVVVASNGKAVGVPFSLRGFTDGARALDWEAFKRSSGVGVFLP